MKIDFLFVIGAIAPNGHLLGCLRAGPASRPNGNGRKPAASAVMRGHGLFRHRRRGAAHLALHPG